MIEKLKKKFKEKKIENLVTFLILLIVTLIIVNQILKEDDVKNIKTTNTIQLVETDSLNNKEEDELENKLESILAKIQGVGRVDVLITYSESSSINPLYNENTSISTTKDNSNENNSKITETQSISKEIITDSSSNPIIQTTTSPKIEGSIITAEGTSNATIKSNIISAVEAATRLSNT